MRKRLALGIAVAVASLLSAWIGTFLYWHVRINQALRSFEIRADQMPDRWAGHVMTMEAHEIFSEAGCRGLPYLVNALSTSKNLKFLETVTYQLTLSMHNSAALEFLQACRIRSDDAVPIREEKCRRLQTWWSEKGSKYHRWWCVWSRQCEAAAPK